MRPDTKFAWLPVTVHALYQMPNCSRQWCVTGRVWLRRVRVVKTLWGDVIYVRI